MRRTLPTRSQVLGQLVTNAVLQARMKWGEYAGEVVAHYHETVDVMDRVVRFHVATGPEDFEDTSRLNTQTIRRLLIGEQRMPSDLEESLLAALPAEARDAAMAELLDRQGLLLARRPRVTTALEAVRAPCDLMRHTASAVERIAPMLQDHVICPADEPYFNEAENALEQVMGTCITVLAQIQSARALTNRAGRNPANSEATGAGTPMASN